MNGSCFNFDVIGFLFSNKYAVTFISAIIIGAITGYQLAQLANQGLLFK